MSPYVSYPALLTKDSADGLQQEMHGIRIYIYGYLMT
jgi:hypothetical protein